VVLFCCGVPLEVWSIYCCYDGVSADIVFFFCGGPLLL